MVLSSIGSSKEVQYWLNHYGNSGKREIAVVKIGGAILRDEEQMKTLVSSVSFLKRQVYRLSSFMELDHN